MTVPIRVALAFLPLAAYFFALGVWQSGPRPRLVSGPKDFGMLAFGLSGLIAFGPIGRWVVDAVFPRPSLPAWLAVASFVGLVAMAWAARTRRRVVVYRIARAELERALSETMGALPGLWSRTVLGFEDSRGTRGVAVEIGRLGIATVEGYGEQPEALIEAIRPPLEHALGAMRGPSSRLPWLWFSLSSAATAIPLAVAASALLAGRK